MDIIKKLYFSIFLVMAVSCGSDRQRKMDLILITLETASRGKSIFLLDESDTSWCWVMDENICTLNRLNTYQLHGNPRNRTPELREIFKADEFDYIADQFKKRVSFKEKNFTSNIQLISQKELDNKSDFELSIFSYFTVSAPAFSENGEYAFIYISEFCGIECGGGDLMIYKREKEKWVRILILGIWLS